MWYVRVLGGMLGCALTANGAHGQGISEELCAPVQVLVGEVPLDVQRTGHSAPFFADMDGDARSDLLVGEFHEGRLRIYRNIGTNSAPKFHDFQWFHAGGQLGRVPSG